MRESELYPAVRDWLAARGYEIHVELFGCDIVCVKNELITAVELKSAFNEKLVRQLHARKKWADFIIGATPSRRDRPQRLDFRNGLMQREGFGLLSVYDDGADLTIEPSRQTCCILSRQRYRLKVMAGRAPAMEHEIAGLPACRQLRDQRLARMAAQQAKGLGNDATGN